MFRICSCQFISVPEAKFRMRYLKFNPEFLLKIHSDSLFLQNFPSKMSSDFVPRAFRFWPERNGIPEFDATLVDSTCSTTSDIFIYGRKFKITSSFTLNTNSHVGLVRSAPVQILTSTVFTVGITGTLVSFNKNRALTS